MTPENDAFRVDRLSGQRPTDISLHPKTDSSASGAVLRPCSAVFGVPRRAGKMAFEKPILRGLAGAVIDTWYYYPKQGEGHRTPSKLPFRELDNLIMTPHVSAWTNNLTPRRCQAIADDLNRLARGEPLINIVKQGHS